MNKRIIIIGDGGHASVLAEILIAQNREIVGYTAPEARNCFFGFPYLGNDDVITSYKQEEVELVLGLGTVDVASHRKTIFDIFKAKGYSFINVVHLGATVSPSVQLGEGIQIMAGAIIQANVKIAHNTIINTGAIIDHDCVIGKNTHISPGTIFSGGVLIGDSCHIGTGTSIIQGITIGNETLIGAGSVVVNDIASKKKAFGVPAKIIK